MFAKELAKLSLVDIGLTLPLALGVAGKTLRHITAHLLI
jgi:hypothetical protein